MPTIRTTMQPNVEIEVSDAEATYLESLGVVHHPRATTEQGIRRSAQRRTTAQDSAQTEES